MKISRLAFALLLVVTTTIARDIQILALFKDKVMLAVDGKQHMLKIGDSVEGITLISANSKTCLLEINGKRETYVLGSQIGINFTHANKPIVHVAQNNRGLYLTQGTINDKAVNFIIDTGANIVAMNANQAMSLGIDYKGKAVQVETASGKASAYHVVLNKITLGPIVAYNVPSVVIEGSNPPEVLLGMTFLNRVEITHKGHLLELRQKY